MTDGTSWKSLNKRHRQGPVSVGVLAVVLVALALLYQGTWAASDVDETLDELFTVLQKSDDLVEILRAEATIWQLWTHHGNPDIDALMARGIAAMGHGDLEGALALFDQLVDAVPGFAEGWNKRATVYYLLGDDAASMADIRRTLALEPRHFGALSGMGLIFIRRGDLETAVDVYREVIDLHPRSPSAVRQLEFLESQLASGAI